MARSQPLYTLEDQFDKLDQMLPANFDTINNLRMRLLIACSESGDLDKAKNRLLNLIQDTEIRTIFSSILEIPEIKEFTGVNPIQTIHIKFEYNYKLFEKAKRELRTVGLPNYTLKLLDDYFFANEDPVYKLSIIAAIIMFGIIMDDKINNRKE